MGVYLPNMEMPETCKLCYLSEFDPGFYAFVCKPTGIWIDYDIAKIDRPRTICPLIPVPPHGRLGDLDAFESVKYELPNGQKAFNRGFHSGVQYMQRLIMDAPTIIPAEEEK